jgi:signal transduction histidine kinase
MTDAERVLRLARCILRTCARGLALALLPVACLPLFIVSVFSVALLSVGVGIVPAPASLLAVRRLAGRQRRVALEWSGVTIVTPYRPRPVEVTRGLIGRLQRCRWLLTDPATWRDLLWTLASVPAGLLGALPAGLIVSGLIGVLSGVWVNPGHFFQLPLFTGMIVFGMAGGRRLLKTHAQVAALLLAPTKKEMAARVDRLSESRSQVVDASAAELRRIERDLHDGAQARLVSLGMSIGLAEQVVRENPELALKLLAEARAASGQALSDLRHLVRGIHPPLLAERGLDGAVRALVLSLPLPVDLTIELPGRLPDPVESAAYFAIAEVLANVVKHSAASRAWAQLEHRNQRLVAIIGDNGTGGADPAAGTGLRGIEQRLAAFDGVIAVTSPAGGPTVVTMELPCALSLART